MIQSTLFNYFMCNGSIQPSVNKGYSFKQTNLTDYFKTVSKKKEKPKKPKKNSILNYFKPKEEKKEFHLVLVDIWNTENIGKITCAKKNMYDLDLRYIAISYRWGELNEQLVKTPDYTARITSFDLLDLRELCRYINNETDLKNIRYLWIDAISVDQYDYARKKETILQMNQIYENASYILAVPDLHIKYLLKNTANKEMIDLIMKYRDVIHDDVFNIEHSALVNRNNHYSTIQKLKVKIKVNKEELRKVYQFLAYLIDDWSNRAWVINEYQIASDKYEMDGTPLKYMFVSLLMERKPFFCYQFEFYNSKKEKLNYAHVYDPITFYEFVVARITKRSFLDKILNSNATRNEDRINAVLAPWYKYKIISNNKNTISKYKITNMTSVRLQLYETMDDYLWMKATLLYACSQYIDNEIILPSFASHHDMGVLELIDISKKLFEYKWDKNFTSVYTENLTSIQLNHHHHYLSVKSNTYFIKELNEWSKRDILSVNSLLREYGDCLHYVYISFFTFTLPDYTSYPPEFGTGIYLIGSIDKNRWLLYKEYELCIFESKHLRSDGYTFNIY